jgi:AraC-like DNA-binding protein
MSSPPSSGCLPLSRFEQLHTLDVGQAQHAVTEAFCPHRLTALDKARQFETRFHSVRTSDVSLSYLDYGGRVHIAPYEQESFYLVLVPLAGRAELSYGREQARYDSNGASVPPVDRKYDIHVSAGSPHLVVWIARNRLEEHLRSMLARPVAKPIRFDLGMDMTAPAVRSWRRVVDLLLAEVDGDGLVPGEPLAMRELERLLLSRLLLAQPNNYSTLLHGQPRGTAPRAIRRAAELIESHAAEPLTVEDIAEATGLSVRTLQEGFRRFLDTTPMSHLREVRLRHVREELAAADPTSTTVTETATRWGFLHSGRFSAQYHQRFGELPSVTLRH